MRSIRQRPARLLWRAIVPRLRPALSRVAHALLSETTVERAGWPRDAGEGRRYENVAVAQEQSWPRLLRNLDGPGPLGVSHLPDHPGRDDPEDQNVMMSFGYVLARAARGKQRLRVLDWGGGLGHYARYGRALLPDVALDYHCHDRPALCRAGKRLQPDVHFHEDPEALCGETFDLVISSSSLHYCKNWHDVAGTLAERCGDFLYVTRLMTVSRVPSFVVTQRARLYDADFPAWVLNRDDVLERFRRLGLELAREFVFAENWMVRHAPEPTACRGFLFRRPT